MLYYVVSIPYSSIKSPEPVRYSLKASSFQFHIVRLKVGMGIHAITSSLVSIPYSSIKSAGLNPYTNSLNAFQFHIVRLKELFLCHSHEHFFRFNSI